jgi:hypothetical protein
MKRKEQGFICNLQMGQKYINYLNKHQQLKTPNCKSREMIDETGRARRADPFDPQFFSGCVRFSAR